MRALLLPFLHHLIGTSLVVAAILAAAWLYVPTVPDGAAALWGDLTRLLH